LLVRLLEAFYQTSTPPLTQTGHELPPQIHINKLFPNHNTLTRFGEEKLNRQQKKFQREVGGELIEKHFGGYAVFAFYFNLSKKHNTKKAQEKKIEIIIYIFF
jgi:hypothetical protein